MKKYMILLVAALAGLTSCEDWLDKTPKSEMTQESYFRTASDLQLFTNPLYNNLLPKEPFKEESDQYIRMDPSNYIRGGVFRNIPNSGGGWTWGNLRRINTCLGNMDKCPDKEAVAQYSALCKFFRAWFYFDKVKQFGDVPWIDHELGSAEEQVYAPRDPREVVMTHMIEDIDDAIGNLPASYPNGHNYRVTKWAALALKARFCLFEGTFRKYHDVSYPEHDAGYYLSLAAEAAEKLMDESGKKLYDTNHPETDYLCLFAGVTNPNDADYNENKDEFILSINFDNSLEMWHNGTAIGLMNSQGRYSQTKKSVDAYLMKDGTRFTDRKDWQTLQFRDEVADRDPRLGQTVRIPGFHRINSTKVESPDLDITLTGFQTIKFLMPADNKANDKFDRSYNDIAVFRLGEVYLNFAEAKAELGTLTQSDLDKSINLLRDRAGMPDLDLAKANADPDDNYMGSAEYGFTNVGGAGKGVILEIRRERMVELAQEGFRYGDLLRWKAGKCLEQNLYGIYFPGPGAYDLDGDGKNEVVLYTANETAPAAGTATCIWQIGKDVYLSEGDRGCMKPLNHVEISFDEKRDYFYPIPIDDRTLNHNLTQNPGWDDGLNF